MGKYTTFWKQFKFSSEVANSIFAPLNGYWIRRELDAGHQDVYEIFNVRIFESDFNQTMHLVGNCDMEDDIFLYIASKYHRSYSQTY